MFGISMLSFGGRSRKRAVRLLFLCHRCESTPDGRSGRLLRKWLSTRQRTEFAQKGYFDVFGGHTGTRYRIYPGTSMNVFELDGQGQVHRGLCFMPIGELPIGDVMLAQKLALENSEPRALAIAKEFALSGFSFRPPRYRR